MSVGIRSFTNGFPNNFRKKERFLGTNRPMTPDSIDDSVKSAASEQSSKTRRFYDNYLLMVRNKSLQEKLNLLKCTDTNSSENLSIKNERFDSSHERVNDGEDKKTESEDSASDGIFERNQTSGSGGPNGSSYVVRLRDSFEMDTDEELNCMSSMYDKMDSQSDFSSSECVRHEEFAHFNDSRFSRVCLIPEPLSTTEFTEGVSYRCGYAGTVQYSGASSTSRDFLRNVIQRFACPSDRPPLVQMQISISRERILVLNNLSKTKLHALFDFRMNEIAQVGESGNTLVLVTIRGNSLLAEGKSVDGERIPFLVAHVFRTPFASAIANRLGKVFLALNGSDLSDDEHTPGKVGISRIRGNSSKESIDQKQCEQTQKEVIIAKKRGEQFGIALAEHAWGSMLPSAVVGAMDLKGPAARNGSVKIGDQLVSVNGLSMIGVPLKKVQKELKALRNQTSARLVFLQSDPVQNVSIRKPSQLYHLGFSIQDGIICSLLRGGRAERSGVCIGHRVIAVNGESVVKMSHNQIKDRITRFVGKLQLRTMPVNLFRLLTGETTPEYV